MAQTFGAVLREYRLRAQLTQEQLAFEADIRRNYVSMLELGQHQPTLTMIFALAAALKCAPSDLLASVETLLKNAPNSKRARRKPTQRRVTASGSNSPAKSRA
ncbi:helix-turn-helix transcriptional regulator [Paraburkholderia unamae]|uniref:helix-turn-helix transcriptional regulator n=1 Tax=Paraburkholderia unamae TaxID=219649 RepID=UPI001C656D0A|nr:helix-turn-helix transcriptional regulator [Paraburkholderia unamae]